MAPIKDIKDTEEIANRITRYFADLNPSIQVTAFQFLVSGVESDIYTFNYQPSGTVARTLILRVYLGDGVAPKILREVNGIHRLHQANFPVANILYYETDPTVLGTPFTIMEKLEGVVLWPLLYKVTSAQADHLLDQFGGLLAQLHRLDWRPFTDQVSRYETNPAVLMDDLLDEYQELYKKFDVIGFIAIVNWLYAHKSKITMHPAVLHLDFHANNVFLCDDHLAVIDWTQISVGDYRADLSWTLMIMGDYGKPGWQDRILQAYCSEAGHPVEDLNYFDVLTHLKLLASIIISLRSGPAGLGLRPETTASVEQQAPLILRLSRRIQQATGISIPEVEEVLNSL
jgi:aminoglycoside phosphotransferase (APT) family kinase protein